MNNRGIIYLVVAIVVIFLIADFFFFHTLIGKDVITDNVLWGVLNSEYGNFEKLGNPVHEQNCLVCDGSGCESLGKPCAKVNISTQEKGVQRNIEVVVTQDGGDGGGYVFDENVLCEGERCVEKDCDYTITTKNPPVSTSYLNTGCDNPLPTCDVTTNTCRECSEGSECIRRVTADYIEEGYKKYEYSIIGSTFTATYRDDTRMCEMEDKVTQIYSDTATLEVCEGLIYSHSTCNSFGICKFI